MSPTSLQNRLLETRHDLEVLQDTSKAILFNTDSGTFNKYIDSDLGKQDILNTASFMRFHVFCKMIEDMYRYFQTDNFEFPEIINGHREPASQYSKEGSYVFLSMSTSQDDHKLSLWGLEKNFTRLVNEKASVVDFREYILEIVGYIESCSDSMLDLPIFDANQLTFLSMIHYFYMDGRVYSDRYLEEVCNRHGALLDPVLNLAFSSNGEKVTSLRHNLVSISRMIEANMYYYAGLGDGLEEFISGVRGRKVLRLRDAFNNMEELLENAANYGSFSEVPSVPFRVFVGVATKQANQYQYVRTISSGPIQYNGTVLHGMYGLFGTPQTLDSNLYKIGYSQFGDDDLTAEQVILDVFNNYDEDIVRVAEDNYNLLLEKLSHLRKDNLRDRLIERVLEDR